MTDFLVLDCINYKLMYHFFKNKYQNQNQNKQQQQKEFILCNRDPFRDFSIKLKLALLSYEL